MTIELDDRKVFHRTFIIADVFNNIIDMDFIRHFSLTLDISGNKILHVTTTKSFLAINRVIRATTTLQLSSPLPKLCRKLVTKTVYNLQSKPFSIIVNHFHEILAKYPKLNRPFSSSLLNNSKKKICHKIVVTGDLCAARARPLSPEKLEFK